MRGWVSAGRGARVAAVTGVLLLGSGVATTVAAEGSPATEPVVQPTSEPAPEPEESLAPDAGTVPAEEAEPATPAVTATDDPSQPAVTEETAVTWLTAVRGRTQMVPWAETFAQLYPDAGEVTLVGVSGPTFGTASVDLSAGTIEYVAPDETPGTDDPLTVTVLAGGTEYQVLFLVTVHHETIGVPIQRYTPAEVPVTFGYVAPERSPDGAAQTEPVPAAGADAAETRAAVPLASAALDRITAIGPVDPAHGSAALDAATGQVTFTPAAGHIGAVQFPYTVTGVGGEATGTVQVDVLPRLADAAVRVATPVDTAVVVHPAAAAGGNGVAVGSTWTDPGHGTLSAPPAPHDLTYTPATGFTGQDTFVVTVTDPAGQNVRVTVTVDVGVLQATGVQVGAGLAVAGAAVLAGAGLVLLRHRALQR
ncbi:Ig-like domain-containing protein [Cellulomonas denverensis]|uniref:Ig-like domain-containing protein n=1 Tax=Cellulomonas denverensis TaxID=264297 RepID=UPI0035E4D094